MRVLTHEAESWRTRNRFTNGAGTYSRDIAESQLAHWQQAFGDRDVLVSTCARVCDLWESETGEDAPELIIQYLHTFPYKDPIAYVKDIISSSRFTDASKWVFVTSYRAYADLMRLHGLNAAYVPMMINRSLVPAGINDVERAVWFGNIYENKKQMFEQIRRAFNRAGILLTVITKGMVNSKREVTQEGAFELIRHYTYGIGVGRCALEMYTMGLKVLVAGAEFGGLVMNDADALVQERTNYNGRVLTWNRSIEDCIEMLPHSHVPKLIDIRDVNHVDIIRNQVKTDQILNR